MAKQTEKKIHPILFLLLLGGLVGVGVIAWNNWARHAESLRLENIDRSIDIENLLSGQILSYGNSENQSSNLETLEKDLSSIQSVKEVLNYVDSLRARDIVEKAKDAAQPETEDNQANSQTTSQPNNRDKNFDLVSEIPSYSDETINLALKGVFLNQGESGQEEWRLKAHWATLRQSSSVLSMGLPVLLYTTGDDLKEIQESQKNTHEAESQTVNLNEFLHPKTDQYTKLTDDNFFKNAEEKLLITAEDGFVYNNNSQLLLRNKVVAKQADNFVQGEILRYNDAQKQAVFPERANFGSKDLKGQANELTWDLLSNEILGKGQVEVIWTPSEK